MEAKIVVLGNSTDWCSLSWADSRHFPNIKFINDILPCGNNNIMAKIARFHYSRKVNRIFSLPFKGIWFNYFCHYKY